MRPLSTVRSWVAALKGRKARIVLSYGFAVVCVALALILLQHALRPYVGERYYPFPAFYAAAALATWLGGRGPGLFALMMGYLGEDWYIVTPYHLEIFSPSHKEILGLIAYGVVGVVIIEIIRRIKSAEGRAKEAAQQAKMERERLEAVLQQMPVGVLIAEAPSGHLSLFNQQAEKIWGRAIHPRILEELGDFQEFHPDGRPYRAEERPIVRSLVSGETITDEEIQFLRGDGKKRIMRVSSAPIRNKEGAIISAVKSLQDVTDRIMAQQAQARLAAIVESSEDAFLAMGLEGVVTAWNAGAERIFGYSRKEILGKSVSILLPPERLAKYQSFLEDLKRGGRTCRYEATRALKDGTRIEIAIVATPIFDAEGKPIGISAIARDITDQKRAEAALQVAQEELKRHAQHLEREVNERTAELQETIQSLEGVCYHIAHDLRAPLRAMQGFSTALLETYSEALDDTGKEFVRRVATAATRMDGLIKDLLEYGRLSHVPLPSSWVSLEAVLKGALGTLADEAATRNASVELSYPMPRVWANSTLLEQIVTNLLSNAFKYVVPGVTPCVRIWTEEDERRTSIFVRDNGIGIDPDQHEKIFRVFERLYVAPQQPGTGIGLAIVQKGAQRMGGRVWVQSEPGKGSCFCVELPRPFCKPLPGIAGGGGVPASAEKKNMELPTHT